MSLYRRNGEQEVVRLLNRLAEGCFGGRRSSPRRGPDEPFGPRGAWVARLVEEAARMEAEGLVGPVRLRRGILTKPVTDPDGRTYTPEMDQEALRLDRQARHEDAIARTGHPARRLGRPPKALTLRYADG